MNRAKEAFKFDATGRLVKAQSGRLAISERSTAATFPNGVYLIQVTSGNRLATFTYDKAIAKVYTNHRVLELSRFL